MKKEVFTRSGVFHAMTPLDFRTSFDYSDPALPSETFTQAVRDSARYLRIRGLYVSSWCRKNHAVMTIEYVKGFRFETDARLFVTDVFEQLTPLLSSQLRRLTGNPHLHIAFPGSVNQASWQREQSQHYN